MKLIKFLIGRQWRSLPGEPTRQYSGCSLIVAAESVEKAKARAVELGQLEGLDVRWIEIADVTEISLDNLLNGQVIGWMQ